MNQSTQKAICEDLSKETNSALDSEFCLVALELAADEVFLLNEDGYAIFVNQSTCDRLGYTRDQLLSMHVWEWNVYVTEESWRRRWEWIQKNDFATFESMHRDANGHPFPVELKVHRVNYKGLNTILCFVHDLTELKNQQRQLSDTAQRLTFVLKGTGLGLWDRDLKSNHMVIDERWAAILGYVPDEIEPHYNSWLSRVHPDDKECVQLAITAHLVGETPYYSQILRMQHRDGHWLYIHDRGQLVEVDQDGTPLRFAGTIEDVTARIELEQTAEMRLNQLEHHQQQILQEKERAEQAVKDLEEANRRKALVYGTIAHELRTPISAISMMSSEDTEGQWSDHQTEIRSICRDLIHTLDDMRMLVNPDIKRAVRYEQFRLSELNASIATAVSAFSALKNIEYRPQIDVPSEYRESLFESDMYRLKVVLSNLVKNACLHSQGSYVHMAVNLEIHQGKEHLCWRIFDDGKGLSEEQAESLFLPYQRGKTEAEGTGLGLYIARSWMEEIGGHLEFVPRSRGAEFKVLLPLEEIAIQDETEPLLEIDQQLLTDIRQRISGMRLLLVEDELTLRLIGSQMMKKLVAHVDVAENGRKGWEMLKSGDYDLLLTDYFMPEMNGVELIKKAKESGFEGVIFGVTAATLGEQTAHMLEAGAHQVFPKPLNASLFMDQLEQTLMNLVESY